MSKVNLSSQKSIYELELHESTIVEDGNLFTTCLRVAGGFMYRSYDKSHNILTSVFVPFDNEFQNPLNPNTKEQIKRERWVG